MNAPVATLPATRSAGRLPLLIAALTCAAWPLVAGAAEPKDRVDTIDETLLKKANDLIPMLQERGYKNIGVLKFQVKKGDRASSYDVGLLNANMATRLEYALVLANSEENPIGIARDCGLVAAQALDKKTTELTPEVCKALFALKYPQAWGRDKNGKDIMLSVDAFLTGQVHLDSHFKTLTVKIQLIDRKSNQPQDILQFPAKITRGVLSDSGEAFSLVKRGGLLKKRGDTLDDEAVVEVDQRTNAAPGMALKNPEAVENLVDLKIFYGDKEQDITVDSSGRRVKEPLEETPVWFRISNKTKDRLAVVLRINGVNTLHEEGPEKGLEQCTKWVLLPNKVYVIKGFYTEDSSVKPFKVVSPAGLTSLDPRKMGLIEVAAFQENQLDDAFDTPKATLRGLAQGQEPPASLKALKNLVRAASSAKPQFKGLILPGQAEAGAKIQQEKMKNLSYAGSMTIRYYP